MKITSGKKLRLPNLPASIRQLVRCMYPNVTFVYVAKKLKFNGIHYHGMALVLEEKDGQLQFEEIIWCLILNEKPVLACRQLKTLEFEQHFNAFIVEKQTQTSLKSLAELLDKFPVGIYPLIGTDHHGIVLRYQPNKASIQM